MRSLALALLLLTLPALACPPVRSQAAKHEFQRVHPCPATHKTSGSCPGYVIDHVEALACGGADKASNMQWQSVKAGHDKDKWERIGCKGGKRVQP